MARITRGVTLVLVGIFFCLSDYALAATLILKSGERIEGQILKQTDKYIQIKRSIGTTIYFIDSIESITSDTPGEVKDVGRPPTPAAAAAKPKGIPEVRIESKPQPSVQPPMYPQVEVEVTPQPEYQTEAVPWIPSLAKVEAPKEQMPEMPPLVESAPPIREIPQQVKPQFGPRDNVMISSWGELLQEPLVAYQPAPEMVARKTQEKAAYSDPVEIKP